MVAMKLLPFFLISLRRASLGFTPLHSLQTARSSSCPTQRGLSEGAPSFRMELDLGEVTAEVELSSPNDAITEAQRIVAQYPELDLESLKHLLQDSWENAMEMEQPRLYEGPVLAPTSTASVVQTIELPSGLILEIAPSTIPAAGLGLFVRSAKNGEGVLQTRGSAFCGYGPCEQILTTSQLERDDFTTFQLQRTFQFYMGEGFDSDVWYDGQIMSILNAMQESGATHVRGHNIVKGPEDERPKLVPDDEVACYLIPPKDPVDPVGLGIRSVGQMANDLAGGGANIDTYDERSREMNVLVLVPRVVMEIDEDSGDGVIVPAGMPVITLATTIVIGNTEPMEIGLQYGQFYWEAKDDSNQMKDLSAHS